MMNPKNARKKTVILTVEEVMALQDMFTYDHFDDVKIIGEFTKEQLEELSKRYVSQLLKRGVKGMKKINFVDYRVKVDDPEMIEDMARKAHQRWYEAKLAEGMKEGDDPDFVPWEQLSERAKEMNRATARETLRQLESVGLLPFNSEVVITAMAVGIHDNWVLEMVNQGFIWGYEKNKDASKGPLTHRDLLPFWMLKALYPEDIRYDMDTAKGSFDSMLAAGYAFVAA